MNAGYPRLTPQELRAAGQALYGAAWRDRMAHVLGVATSEVFNVEAGVTPAPSEWRARLIEHAQSVAVRALDTASELLWRSHDVAPPEPPRAVAYV
jgi:hypothetical protein